MSWNACVWDFPCRDAEKQQEIVFFPIPPITGEIIYAITTEYSKKSPLRE
jgi:hypothetical protein